MDDGAVIAQTFEAHRRGVDASERELSAGVAAVADRLLATFRDGRSVYVFGNGGSAADAQHFAAELVGRFRRERRALPAMALTTDSSILTAVANDYGFEDVFARQVEALARPGDAVVAISTSGMSENVILGLRQAGSSGAYRIGLLGRGGGEALSECDLALVVPSDDTARVQEIHAILVHLVCDLVETRIADV